MRVLIAGGTGFLGSALAGRLRAAGHEVWVLTRRSRRAENEIQWSGTSADGWSRRLDQVDSVVNVSGYGLEHWPWTPSRKQQFVDSRVRPGEALTAAIRTVHRPPRVFIQISGINYYGATGEGIADEDSPAAGDFLAQLTVKWEASTKSMEELGVRRVVARSAVVLAIQGGLFPLMALPVRLYVGGPLGSGKQAVPWIHLEDEVRALQFLLENEAARGAFNLIAPQGTSNAEFMRSVAKAAGRPYWLRTPAWPLRILLGEMSTLILEGRYSRPRRLEELGFKFQYPTIEAAASALFRRSVAS